MVAQTHQSIGSIKLISEVYNYSGYFSCLEGNKEEHFLFFLSWCILQKHIFFCLEQLCITLTASLQGFQATFPPVSANQAGKLLNKTFSGINLQNCLPEWEESFCYVSVFKLFFFLYHIEFWQRGCKVWQALYRFLQNTCCANVTIHTRASYGWDPNQQMPTCHEYRST